MVRKRRRDNIVMMQNKIVFLKFDASKNTGLNHLKL